jgi:hypothetical protein
MLERKSWAGAQAFYPFKTFISFTVHEYLSNRRAGLKYSHLIKTLNVDYSGEIAPNTNTNSRALNHHSNQVTHLGRSL